MGVHSTLKTWLNNGRPARSWLRSGEGADGPPPPVSVAVSQSRRSCLNSSSRQLDLQRFLEDVEPLIRLSVLN